MKQESGFWWLLNAGKCLEDGSGSIIPLFNLYFWSFLLHDSFGRDSEVSVTPNLLLVARVFVWPPLTRWKEKTRLLQSRFERGSDFGLSGFHSWKTNGPRKAVPTCGKGFPWIICVGLGHFSWKTPVRLTEMTEVVRFIVNWNGLYALSVFSFRNYFHFSTCLL